MKATLLIQNGRIRTMDENVSHADSLAAIGGRIAAVGSQRDLSALIGATTEVLDLGGRILLPGFIDSHEHFSTFCEIPLQLDLSPSKVKTVAKILEVIESEAKRVGPNEWIRGKGYDDTKILDGRMPTLTELDRAAPRNPVILIHVSAHLALANSEALRRGGLDRNAVDPPGGRYGRDRETGELTGQFVGMAGFNFWSEAMSGGRMTVPPLARQVRKQALIDGAALLNRAGLTSIHDPAVAPSYIMSYHDALRDHLLPLRVNMLVPYHWLDDLERLGLTGNWGNEWVRSTGIKIVVDGAIAGRTAAMREPYSHDPTDHGLLYLEDRKELNDLVRRIHALGYQACIHANGDLAIDMALDAIEKAQRENPRPDPRHRIEHCTIINDAILRRMRELGVMATPFASYLWQHSEKLVPYYGLKRAEMMFAHGTFLERGIKVAGASDHPAGLLEPLLGVQSMVTRRTPSGEVLGANQRITVEEAFKMYTRHAAYASFEEHVKGSLAPGRLADMVVLAEDPWEVDPGAIGGIPVLMTIVGGRVVYDRLR